MCEPINSQRGERKEIRHFEEDVRFLDAWTLDLASQVDLLPSNLLNHRPYGALSAVTPALQEHNTHTHALFWTDNYSNYREAAQLQEVDGDVIEARGGDMSVGTWVEVDVRRVAEKSEQAFGAGRIWRQNKIPTFFSHKKTWLKRFFSMKWLEQVNHTAPASRWRSKRCTDRWHVTICCWTLLLPRASVCHVFRRKRIRMWVQHCCSLHYFYQFSHLKSSIQVFFLWLNQGTF